MSSVGSSALSECMNETAKITEEFQAACLLLAANFQAQSQQPPQHYNLYPTFTKRNKKRHPSKPNKPEIPSEPSTDNDDALRTLILRLSQKNGKPISQDFIQKIKKLYDASSTTIRNQIVQLVAKGEIEDSNQLDSFIQKINSSSK